ncbi:hypothetical protein SAMN05444162_4872 [Paenibacillaceae bacterium GAS479]|nr:hypothetical protein SAMN05444162_4872 [Paenibacillaceae bacterium GAS479]
MEVVRAELNELLKQVAEDVLLKLQQLDELLNAYNRALSEGE